MQDSAFIFIAVVFATAISAPIFVLLMVTSRKFRAWVGAVTANVASGAVANIMLMFPSEIGGDYDPINPLPYIIAGFVIGFVVSLVIFLTLRRGRGGQDDS